MSREIKGTIKEVGDTGEYGKSNFKKRQLLVIEDVEKYPQTLPIDFVQDKCTLLDSYQAGDEVIVHFNLRGSDFNDKYYVSLQGWKIEKTVASQPQPVSAPPVPPKEAFDNVEPEEEHDDLPF